MEEEEEEEEVTVEEGRKAEEEEADKPEKEAKPEGKDKPEKGEDEKEQNEEDDESSEDNGEDSSLSLLAKVSSAMAPPKSRKKQQQQEQQDEAKAKKNSKEVLEEAKREKTASPAPANSPVPKRGGGITLRPSPILTPNYSGGGGVPMTSARPTTASAAPKPITPTGARGYPFPPRGPPPYGPPPGMPPPYGPPGSGSGMGLPPPPYGYPPYAAEEPPYYGGGGGPPPSSMRPPYPYRGEWGEPPFPYSPVLVERTSFDSVEQQQQQIAHHVTPDRRGYDEYSSSAGWGPPPLPMPTRPYGYPPRGAGGPWEPPMPPDDYYPLAAEQHGRYTPTEQQQQRYGPYTYVQQPNLESKTVLRKKFSWKHYPEVGSLASSFSMILATPPVVASRTTRIHPHSLAPFCRCPPFTL